MRDRPIPGARLGQSSPRMELTGELPAGDNVIGEVVLPVGQTTAAASTSVVLAFDQGALDVNIVSGGGSGGLTDTQLRATPVPVTVSGGATGLTNAELRAAVVPVSLASTTVTGSVAVTGPLTDIQLRASVVPVSLTSTTITGTVAATQSGTWNIGSIAALPALAAGTANIGDVDVLTLPVAFDTGLTTATTQRVVAAADLEMATTQGITSLRDALVAQRYTVLADSIADGINATWTSTVANGGTTTSTGGEGLIQTSANAAGAALLVSITVNYYPGQVSWFNSAIRFNDTGSAGNIRRIGVFTLTGTTPQEGAYFELNGTTLNAVVVKAGVATAVASTAWTRFAVAPFTLDTNYCSFEIRWTANTFLFFVNNVLRHTVSGTATPLTTTLNFPMAIQSINTSGATNRLIAVRNCGIGRFGSPEATKDNSSLLRVERNFILDTYTAAPAVEAMQQVVQWYANAAVAATAQPAVVPAGKILRITGGRIETKSLATVGSVIMRMRANTAGLAVLASPLVASTGCGSRSGATTVAMTGGLDTQPFTFGERGHEFLAGTGIGFSLAGYGPTGTLALQGVTRFEVWGYEYMP